MNTIVGDVLAVNGPMLTLAQELGFSIGGSPDERTVMRATLGLGGDQTRIHQQ